MPDPFVSVLMTSYNRQDLIGDAIKSVLNSTYEDFELIIVDDCSKDETLKRAQEFSEKDKRIKVYKNERNLGDYPNRNKAASYARGKYIKYLDSDDIIYPHGLEVMINSMKAYPNAGFGLSSVSDVYQPFPQCVDSHDAYVEHFTGFGHFDRAPGSSIIKTACFNYVAGFSGKRMIGDYELWFKLANLFSLVKFPRDLVWDRIHAGQERSSDYAKQYSELRNQVLKKALKNPGCPLNKAEKDKYFKKHIRKSIKDKLQKWI